jgi:hypothetical protein
MAQYAEDSLETAREALADLVYCLGDAALLRSMLLDATEVRQHGLEGCLFCTSDAEQSIVIAARQDEIEFQIGGSGRSQVVSFTALDLLIPGIRSPRLP